MKVYYGSYNLQLKLMQDIQRKDMNNLLLLRAGVTPVKNHSHCAFFFLVTILIATNGLYRT